MSNCSHLDTTAAWHSGQSGTNDKISYTLHRFDVNAVL